MAQAQAVKSMLWEGKPTIETAGQLRQMGIGSIVFDPCATPPAEGDFHSVMKKNLAVIDNLKFSIP